MYELKRLKNRLDHLKLIHKNIKNEQAKESIGRLKVIIKKEILRQAVKNIK